MRLRGCAHHAVVVELSCRALLAPQSVQSRRGCFNNGALFPRRHHDPSLCLPCCGCDAAEVRTGAEKLLLKVDLL